MRWTRFASSAVVVAGAAAQGSPLGASEAAKELKETCEAEVWAEWDAFVSYFISVDGRVIEHTAEDRTTSEGQAYAMFHALVAGDRALFDRVLGWTISHLAKRDLRKHLPAWKWGLDAQGRWRVLDRNSASDADLWMTYALLEAGRLWSAPKYTELARAMHRNIIASEVTTLPGRGEMLLPGPVGFALRKKGLWRLNPSYVPIQVLRRLAGFSRTGPWNAIIRNAVEMISSTTPRGFVPDWVAFRADEGFVTDPVSGPIGSYDAIRVYLWAGTLAAEDEARGVLLRSLAGPHLHWRRTGSVPERVDTLLGHDPNGASGPVGFLGAILPIASAGEWSLEDQVRLTDTIRSTARGFLFGDPPRYYDQNLLLFSLAFIDGRYKFGAGGELEPRWKQRCDAH